MLQHVCKFLLPSSCGEDHHSMLASAVPAVAACYWGASRCFGAFCQEHLLEVNEDIGLYFDDAPAKEEDYDAPHVDVEAVKANLHDLRGKASESFEQLRGALAELGFS